MEFLNGLVTNTFDHLSVQLKDNEFTSGMDHAGLNASEDKVFSVEFSTPSGVLNVDFVLTINGSEVYREAMGFDAVFSTFVHRFDGSIALFRTAHVQGLEQLSFHAKGFSIKIATTALETDVLMLQDIFKRMLDKMGDNAFGF